MRFLLPFTVFRAFGLFLAAVFMVLYLFDDQLVYL